jgi:hypothetical protein
MITVQIPHFGNLSCGAMQVGIPRKLNHFPADHSSTATANGY